MRHFASAARVYLLHMCVLAASAFSAAAGADELTVDLLAPSTPCVGNKCPSDISLPELGSSIPGSNGKYDSGLTSFTVATAALPVVCNEVRGTTAPYQYGPTAGADQFAPTYINAGPGARLDFDVADVNANRVDGSFGFSGIFAVTRANTTQSQVACYAINHLGDATPQYANSSASGDRVFNDPFDGGHRSGEPWVSINTVSAPSGAAHVLAYVLQIHNASAATNWHLSFGYDHLFFSKAVNGNFPGQWYVLNSTNNAQPGAIGSLTGAVNGTVESPYTVAATDIQAATNSVYLYVSFNSSSTAVSAWAGLASTFYPASASIFAPTGTYAQRLDDKSSVAGNANVPAQNIGNIVCANDPAASACTIFDQDGNIATFKYANTVSTGTVTIDPVAYVVDTAANTTLPSTTASLSVSNVSCDDPQGIFASPVGTSNFATSSGASGARKLQFNFKPSGVLFVPGTATCTGTFSAGGLSSTQSFTVTMQQLTTTHFDVTADPTAIAGVPASFTVTAKDGAGNTVTSYNGIVQFGSSDITAVLPGSSTLINGVGTFNGTLKKSGPQTFTATDGTITGTSNSVAVTAAAATHFQVIMLGNATVSSPTGANVTALDAFGNEATTYVGLVHFSSTDGSATLPVDGVLNHVSHGSATITFNAVGTWTVSVTDTVTGSITGTSDSVLVEN